MNAEERRYIAMLHDALADSARVQRGLLAELGALRDAARRLSDAISDRAAVGTDGLFPRSQQEAAEDEYRAALKALRAALTDAPDTLT